YRQVRRRALGDKVSVLGILALPRKYCGHTRVPGFLAGRQDVELVVHQDIVLSRVTSLDIIERLFFVNIDEHVAFYRFENARAFNLARLKNHVAIGKDYGLSPRAESLNHVKRSGIETIGERVVDQERRHGQQVNIFRVLDAVALQGAEIIAVAQLIEELFENRPVPVAAGRPELTLKVALEVILNAIVVQQRVVDVD